MEKKKPKKSNGCQCPHNKLKKNLHNILCVRAHTANCMNEYDCCFQLST